MELVIFLKIFFLKFWGLLQYVTLNDPSNRDSPFTSEVPVTVWRIIGRNSKVHLNTSGLKQ